MASASIFESEGEMAKVFVGIGKGFELTGRDAVASWDPLLAEVAGQREPGGLRHSGTPHAARDAKDAKEGDPVKTLRKARG